MSTSQFKIAQRWEPRTKGKGSRGHAEREPFTILNVYRGPDKSLLIERDDGSREQMPMADAKLHYAPAWWRTATAHDPLAC